ncbi:MAG TPA: diacylglycerol kinase family lipid kinase, partial [Burkholderiaceae bacterium]|nr:diacylglycerol kinase family lipid kinase [Burkholderiaceae bacterium]
PLDPVQALRTVIEGQTTTVDVGEVNGHFFVNNSSLGLYPDIVRQRELLRSRLGHGKWGAFAWATLAALKRFPFLNVKLSLEGQQRLHRTPFVFVGNGEYLMQGLQVGTRARLTDGRLCVYLAGQGGRLDLLKLAVAALFGRLKQARDFCALQAREIVIETPRSRLRVATDGEVRLLGTPLTYRIHPHALRVVVPAVRG